MDFSEEYIKMCDCEEIQGLRKDKEGDFVVTNLGKIDVISGYFKYFEDEHLYDDEAKEYQTKVWLPCQEDLQEMIHDYRYKQRKFSGSHGLLGDFAYWVEEKSNIPCASMGQLWLAFVMHEKHNKVWVDGEWVLSKRRS